MNVLFEMHYPIPPIFRSKISVRIISLCKNFTPIIWSQTNWRWLTRWPSQIVKNLASKTSNSHVNYNLRVPNINCMLLSARFKVFKRCSKIMIFWLMNDNKQMKINYFINWTVYINAVCIILNTFVMHECISLKSFTLSDMLGDDSDVLMCMFICLY
jgi:hypothetical protein